MIQRCSLVGKFCMSMLAVVLCNTHFIVTHTVTQGMVEELGGGIQTLDICFVVMVGIDAEQ